jgi:LysM repeat protein
MRKKLGNQLESGMQSLREWFRRKPQAQRRLLSGGLGLIVVAVLTLVAAMPRITSASEVNALGNGSFEQGFTQINGCGVVALQWQCFTNGGAAAYGFYDDQWEPVVYEGKSSQMIEINTKDLAAGDNDRYAGIYQTARVVKGAPYKLSMRGMIRTTNSEGDPWRYSVQVGWINGPKGEWSDVTNWTDVGWNSYFKRTEPGAHSAFETQLVPDSEVITLFIRVWKKWGVAYEEVDVNFDAISLTGPATHQPNAEPQRPDGPHQYPGVGGPVQQESWSQEPQRPEGRPEESRPQEQRPQQGPQEQQPQEQQPQEQQPQEQQPQEQQPQEVKPQESRPQESQADRPSVPQQEYPVACSGEDLLYNGSFEAGFNEVPWGDVGRGWDAFTNGGAANYGFYDEEWDIVVADGQHGQLIEINSKSVYPTDADRYAGIYQRVGGLHPGATYELTLRGELRGVGNEDDPYRFAAQWGLGWESNWESVDEWTTMDLGPIGVRTQPLPLAQYKVRFEAPASSVVLFVRGWKKFGITNVEMDLNLDAISLRACNAQGPQKQQPPQPSGWQPESVKPQQPTRPVEGGKGEPSQGNPNPGNPNQEKPNQGNPNSGNRPEEDHGSSCLYVVKPGDALGQIALDHGVSMEVIIRANGIEDPSNIYVGQKFEIPGCEGGRYSAEPVRVEPVVVAPSLPVMAAASSLADVTEVQVEVSGVEVIADTYTVQGGDMLTAIAEAYGVDAFTLATYNGIDNLNFIYEGQVLAIPN